MLSGIRIRMLFLGRRGLSTRQMAPQYQWLTVGGATAPKADDVAPLLNEVLRCGSFQQPIVLQNVLTIIKEPTKNDGLRLAKSKFLAMVFHNIKEEKEPARSTIKMLAEQVEQCKMPKLLAEQRLFLESMGGSASSEIPKNGKFIFKDDLIHCYFKKAMESGNFEDIRSLIATYPNQIQLFEHLEEFLEKMKEQKSKKSEIMSMIMEVALRSNKYFIELQDFEKSILKCAKVLGWQIAKYNPEEELGKPKKFISQKECDILKSKIDEHVKKTKEGFVKSKEYASAIRKVQKWKKEENIRTGESVVVVDSLNFGQGVDPTSWTEISEQFKIVKFATRRPPANVRDKVMRRYNGNALFCDKLSADDLIILRMALEMGPATSMVTNDRYRDHRLAICGKNEEIRRIWDDFIVDGTYRHNSHWVEKRRDFNLRIFRAQNDNSTYFLPVVETKNESDQMRNFQFFRISP